MELINKSGQSTEKGSQISNEIESCFKDLFKRHSDVKPEEILGVCISAISAAHLWRRFDLKDEARKHDLDRIKNNNRSCKDYWIEQYNKKGKVLTVKLFTSTFPSFGLMESKRIIEKLIETGEFV